MAHLPNALAKPRCCRPPAIKTARRPFPHEEHEPLPVLSGLCLSVCLSVCLLLPPPSLHRPLFTRLPRHPPSSSDRQQQRRRPSDDRDRPTRPAGSRVVQRRPETPIPPAVAGAPYRERHSCGGSALRRAKSLPRTGGRYTPCYQTLLPAPATLTGPPIVIAADPSSTGNHPHSHPGHRPPHVNIINTTSCYLGPRKWLSGYRHSRHTTTTGKPSVAR